MTTAHTARRERLCTMLGAMGAEPKRPTERDDGLTDIVQLGGGDQAAITAAGDDLAVITIVTRTRKARRVIEAVAREYGITPGLRGI